MVGIWGGPLAFVLLITFATMGVFVQEQASGTMAWNLTQPLSRTALLLAKWAAGTLALWVTVVVVPTLIGLTVAGLIYGVVPGDSLLAASVVALSAVWIAFYVLLILALSTLFGSQGVIAGVVVALLVAPNLAGGISPAVQELLDAAYPTNMPAWMYVLAAGEGIPTAAVASSIVVFAALAILAAVAFDRKEF